MLFARTRTVSTTLGDQALLLRLASAERTRPPGRYPLPHGHTWSALAALTAARFGGARFLGAELWVLDRVDPAPAVHGSGIALPGLHTVRWLVGVEGRLWLRAGVGAPGSTLAPGEARCWDLDRDPAAFHTAGRWVGVAVHFAAGPLAGVARWLAAGRTEGRPSTLSARLVTWIGFENASYTLAWAAVSVAQRSPVPFVAATSFIHYGIYIVTFARRRDVAYGEFLRDALWFKALSMGSLAWVLATTAPWSAPGAALVVLGVGLSMWAARVLGVERTYFGEELGRIPAERVRRLPYGLIPHPMITGAVIALIGVGVQPGVAREWPWLVPAHVLAYAAHLAQEVFQRGHHLSAGSTRRRHGPAADGR
jgi:Phospholipid methyltransferase